MEEAINLGSESTYVLKSEGGSAAGPYVNLLTAVITCLQRFMVEVTLSPMPTRTHPTLYTGLCCLVFSLGVPQSWCASRDMLVLVCLQGQEYAAQ